MRGVPSVLNWRTIEVSEAICTWPKDFSSFIWAFPRWRHFIELGGHGSWRFAEHEIIEGETFLLWFCVAIVADFLLVFCHFEECRISCFFEEIVIQSEAFFWAFYVEVLYPRRSNTNLNRQYCFRSVCQLKRRFSRWSFRGSPVTPKDIRELIHPISVSLDDSLFDAL